jgi:hypothetical protein
MSDFMKICSVGAEVFYVDGYTSIYLHVDHKGSVHLMITMPHYSAQSNCLSADRHGRGDTRLTLTQSVIPNSNYVITVTD